ncbi:hypothetical protein TanjilG_19946 [Lupinus angustifolius]|uniref:Uncharacterized protein n=1 Tax=Lupinus angustifolius TaxID=3871 RepID=A0A1J7FNF8_LUPAN|nr:hypothetical protein TanjilG_19946 [Lupinus angustifolius]
MRGGITEPSPSHIHRTTTVNHLGRDCCSSPLADKGQPPSLPRRALLCHHHESHPLGPSHERCSLPPLPLKEEKFGN